MKALSTVFFVIVTLTGIGLKLARLNHMANTGEAMSAFEFGKMHGERAAGKGAVSNGSVQSNPFASE